MTETFGEYDNDIQPSDEYLVVGFSPSSIPLKQRWRNSGLSADFLADYLTTFFPVDESKPGTVDRQAEVKSAVGYIANELLENAMKFSDDRLSHPISIRLQLHTDRLIFVTTNTIPLEKVSGFQAYIKRLTTEDPQELYIERLEKTATEEHPTTSGLGYLTMINDYHAQLGWKFEHLETEADDGQLQKTVAVTTMVQLVVSS